MMVASPDHLLDPRYYPEQHEEWAREENEMPSYAVKIDANHVPIKRAAQSYGVFVKDTYQFAQFDPGHPDQMWLVKKMERAPEGGYWRHISEVWMIEVKNGFDQKLTPAEHKWINEWRDNGGVAFVLHSLDEAIKLLKAMRRGQR